MKYSTSSSYILEKQHFEKNKPYVIKLQILILHSYVKFT